MLHKPLQQALKTTLKASGGLAIAHRAPTTAMAETPLAVAADPQSFVWVATSGLSLALSALSSAILLG